MRDNRHPNRIRLENNQEQALQLAQDVINGDSPESDKASSKQISPVSNIQTRVEYDNFSPKGLTALAHQFDIKRDQDRNIKRYTVDHADGTKSLVRDARLHTTPSDNNIENKDPNSVHMQMISSTRAALHMINTLKNDGKLKDEEYDKIKKRLHKIYNDELKDYPNNKKEDLIKKLKNYNGKVLSVLKQSEVGKIKDIDVKADLGITMHSMNFLNEDYHITTLNKGPNDSTVIESDVLMLGVTKEQKDQLIALKENNNSVLEGLNWYNTLSPYKQNLARFAADQMLQKDDKGQYQVVKKVPTQLRNLIPFGKNMYTKFSYLQTGDNKPPKLVSENAHTGAIYYGRKTGDRDQQVREIASQAQSFTPTRNTKINQIITVSPNNPFNRNEARMTEQTRKAMSETGNTTSTTPFNLFRKFYPIDKNGYDKTLINIAAVTKNVLPGSQALTDYLETGYGKKAAENFLKTAYKNAKTPEKKDFLESLNVAVQARALLDKRIPLFEGFGNDNLKLYEYFSELNTAIHNPKGAVRTYVDNTEWGIKNAMESELRVISNSMLDSPIENINNQNEKDIRAYLAGKVTGYDPLVKPEDHKQTLLNYLEDAKSKATDPAKKAYIEMLASSINIRNDINTISTQTDSAKRKDYYEFMSEAFDKTLSNVKASEYLNRDNITKVNKTGHIYYDESRWNEKIASLELNCASGKDRTGIAMFVATLTGVARSMGAKMGLADDKPKDNEATLKTLAQTVNKGGHSQIIPSQNDCGTHGVMPNSSQAENFSYFKDNTLTRETARTNKFTAQKGVKVDIKKLDQEIAEDVNKAKSAQNSSPYIATPEHLAEFNSIIRGGSKKRQDHAEEIKNKKINQQAGDGKTP